MNDSNSSDESNHGENKTGQSRRSYLKSAVGTGTIPFLQTGDEDIEVVKIDGNEEDRLYTIIDNSDEFKLLKNYCKSEYDLRINENEAKALKLEKGSVSYSVVIFNLNSSDSELELEAASIAARITDDETVSVMVGIEIKRDDNITTIPITVEDGEVREMSIR